MEANVYTYKVSRRDAPNCDIMEEVVAQDLNAARTLVRDKYGWIVMIDLLKTTPVQIHEFSMSVNEAKESFRRIVDKNTNDIIWAIKVFRSLTGCDLLTARNAVFEVLNRDFRGKPLPASSEFRGETSNKV